jgi:hypothetical protein
VSDADCAADGIIRSSFIVDNAGTGLELEAGSGVPATRPTIDFTTIVGNAAMNCLPFGDVQIPVTNVVVVGLITNPLISVNDRYCAISTCVTRNLNQPGCTSSTSLGFEDEASGNYHLQPSLSNPAINAASGGVGQLDFDGEVRPKGAAADLGADEAM